MSEKSRPVVFLIAQFLFIFFLLVFCCTMLDVWFCHIDICGSTFCQNDSRFVDNRVLTSLGIPHFSVLPVNCPFGKRWCGEGYVEL